MNVKADDLATSYLKNHKTEEDGGPLANSAHFQAMHASLINNGTRVHSRASLSLRTTMQTNRYDVYFQNKHRLSAQKDGKERNEFEEPQRKVRTAMGSLRPDDHKFASV